MAGYPERNMDEHKNRQRKFCNGARIDRVRGCIDILLSSANFTDFDGSKQFCREEFAKVMNDIINHERITDVWTPVELPQFQAPVALLNGCIEWISMLKPKMVGTPSTESACAYAGIGAIVALAIQFNPAVKREGLCALLKFNPKYAAKVQSLIVEPNFLRLMSTREKKGFFMNEVIRESVIQCWIDCSKELPFIRDCNKKMWEGKLVPLMECSKPAREVAAEFNADFDGIFHVSDEYVRIQKPEFIKAAEQETCVCPYHLIWNDRHEATLSLFAMVHSLNLLGTDALFWSENQHVIVCPDCGPNNALLRKCNLEDLGCGRSKLQTQAKWKGKVPENAFVFHDFVVDSAKQFAQMFLCKGES